MSLIHLSRSASYTFYGFRESAHTLTKLLSLHRYTVKESIGVNTHARRVIKVVRGQRCVQASAKSHCMSLVAEGRLVQHRYGFTQMLARSSHGFLTQPNTTTALLGLSTRRCSRVWTLCRRPRCTWRGQPLESVSRDCYPWRGWSDTVPGPPGVTFCPRPRLTAAEQRPCAPPS